MFKLTPLLLVALVCAGAALAKQCGEKPDSRIVGGNDATRDQFPWQVSWRFYNQSTKTHRHICGASIIGDKWVLTAAHCVDVVKPLEEKNFRAYVGLLSQSAPESTNAKLLTIKKITIHPNWDSQQIINDVAVVELDQPIDLEGSNLNAICLGRPTDAVEGVMSVISGWGLTVHGGSQIPDILQWATVPVEKQSTCKSIYSFIKPLTDGEVCAGKNPGGCNGDSGGPLQYEQDGRWYLLGAASWVVRCGSPTYPTVWARVPSFLKFITEVSGISPPA